MSYSDHTKTDIQTFEININATELQLHPQQSLSESLMVVADARFLSSAEGQGEVAVSLLPIVVGAHCVHPQHHFIPIFILKYICIMKKCMMIKEQ